MGEQFHDGMVAYEQLCEGIMERLNIPDDIAMFIQINILDTAQRDFETIYK